VWFRRGEIELYVTEVAIAMAIIMNKHDWNKHDWSIRFNGASIMVSIPKKYGVARIEVSIRWPPSLSIRRKQRTLHQKTVYMFGIFIGIVSCVYIQEVIPNIILRARQ